MPADTSRTFTTPEPLLPVMRAPGTRRIDPAENVVNPASSVTRAAGPNCSARLPTSMVDPPSTVIAALTTQGSLLDWHRSSALIACTGDAKTRPASSASDTAADRTLENVRIAFPYTPAARRATSHMLDATMAASLRTARAGAASHRVRPLRHRGRRRAPACIAVRRVRATAVPRGGHVSVLRIRDVNPDLRRTARDAATLHRRRHAAARLPRPGAVRLRGRSRSRHRAAGDHTPHRGRPRSPAVGQPVRLVLEPLCADDDGTSVVTYAFAPEATA